MASRTLDKNNDDPEEPGVDSTIRMDQDDTTEAAGANREKNGAAVQEINVKWQLPGKQDAATSYCEESCSRVARDFDDQPSNRRECH